MEICFIRRLCRPEKHISPRKCGIFAPTGQKLCAQSTRIFSVKKALASVPTGTPTDDWTAFAKATKLKAGVLKKIRPFITEKDPTAQPIEGECDSDLRDTELVPFTYAGGITGFMRDEVLT